MLSCELRAECRNCVFVEKVVIVFKEKKASAVDVSAQMVELSECSVCVCFF